MFSLKTAAWSICGVDGHCRWVSRWRQIVLILHPTLQLCSNSHPSIHLWFTPRVKCKAKTERRTTDVCEWVDGSPLGHEWRWNASWVLWERAWLWQIQQVNVGGLCHVACPEGTQHSTTSGSPAFTVFLTKMCFPFPVCNIKTTCCCEDVGGLCFLLLINRFLCPGILL